MKVEQNPLQSYPPFIYDAYFVLDYATRTWNQKTGENIGALTDNDEIQLIKALNKLVKYEYGVERVKNRRGR